MRQTLSEFDEHDEGFGLVGDERDDEARPARRLPMLALTVLVMALFAGALWFAYNQGTRHPVATAQNGDAVPLLRADTAPTKVKPDQPGGMTIPDQGVSLYNEKTGGPPVEKLLPAAEQPMPRPAPTANEPPPSASPSASAAAAAAPPATAPSAKPAAAAKAAAPAATGSVRLRLGSVRTPEAARDEWARLKRENQDLLGKLTAVAVRADLGEKGVYYRIEAGTFADAGAAEKLCDELKRRNHGCLLAR